VDKFFCEQQTFKLIPSPCLLVSVENDEYIVSNVTTAFLELFGSHESQLIGKNIFQLYTGKTDELQATFQSSLKLARAQKIKTKEVQFTLGNKTHSSSSFFEFHYIPIQNELGIVDKIIHSVTYLPLVPNASANTHKNADTDVLTVKNIPVKIETNFNLTELINAQKTLNKIFETSLDVICVVDQKGRFKQVSAASEQVWGYKPEEMAGKPLLDFVYEDDKSKTQDTANKVMSGEQIRHFENRYVHKNGSIVHISWSASWNGVDKTRYGVARNITDKKNAEQALIASEKKYRNLFENNPLAMVIIEPISLKLLDCNGETLKTYGYTKEEILTLSLSQLIHTNEHNPPAAQQYGVKNYTDKTTAAHSRKNGDLIFVECSEQNIEFQGQAAKLVTLNNITERILAENQLQKLNEEIQLNVTQLARSNSDLEQFAYVASHDLQEPLRMISSFMSELEKSYGHLIDVVGKKYMRYAIDGAVRMREIIHDLLEYSRIGNVDANTEKIDLNDLLLEIENLFRKIISEKNAVIIREQLPVIQGQKALLTQIFMNLIGNALKYCKDDVPPIVEIDVVEHDSFFQYSVKDNGIGIDKLYFDKIFQAFQRLHGREKYSGTGIGLAITKKLIENAKGKIWLKSKPGIGSTFYFTLPKH